MDSTFQRSLWKERKSMEKKTNVSFPPQQSGCSAECWSRGSNPQQKRGRVCQWPLEHVGYFCFLSCSWDFYDAILLFKCIKYIRAFPGGSIGKKNPLLCRRCRRLMFNPWVGKIPWRRAWQPTPAFLPRESYGQGSLAVTKSHKESHTTEATDQAHTSIKLKYT